ncbi:tetratricopeptide repeat protein [Xanthomarina sp.]|uniref:tetratricopeptide repeat protein n=1 Tax=Xanthomarina sp. TaxID=1931211 RepID=UPI002BB11C43|nr:tetratricopeptide repeat protein [Xanthomarina sp.]HLV39566.1 tetratricopeptide repeat protein [Xanthomarina sp.]
MKLIDFLAELQRRNVIKAAISYVVFSWVLIQAASILYPVMGWGHDAVQMTLIVLLIGFPVWIVFAYIFEWTPKGFKKTVDVETEISIAKVTNKKLNGIIIAGLSLAVLLLVADRIFNFTSAAKTKIGNDKSIAVLAFVDMSPNKDQEYFSDGISEELLNILVKIPNLKVISRTSSFSYKDKHLKATEIGKELNVSHILEGSIRKAGNTVRITAQLINTTDGSHEWSQAYDRSLDSIFKVQEEIAQEVGNQLELSIMGKINSLRTPVTEAYNLYLQAKHLTYQNSKESYILAEELVKQSIAIDSSYSNSWELLANIYDSGSYNFSIGDTHESNIKGIKAVEKAIEINPNNANAYATLASLQSRIWKFEASAKNMKKALELEPNNAVIIGVAALMTFGNIEKSIRLLKTAIELDPLVYTNYYNLGAANYKLNRLDEAMEALNKFSIYYPNIQILHYMKAKVLLAQGHMEEALAENDKETHEFFNLYGKNFILFAMKGKAGTELIFKEFIEKYSNSDPSNMADLYAFRGDYDTAFEYLNKAFLIKDPVLLEALAYPSFQPMYKDSRWKALINNMGLPADQGYHLN